MGVVLILVSSFLSGIVGSVLGIISGILVGLYPQETKQYVRYLKLKYGVLRELWSWEIKLCIKRGYFRCGKEKHFEDYLHLLRETHKDRRFDEMLRLDNSCCNSKEKITYKDAKKEEGEYKFKYNNYKEGLEEE